MKRKIYFFLMLLFSVSTAIAQNKTVTGKVTSETGEALTGVTVSLKGSKTVTITNTSGNYSIQVPSQGNIVLEFSYVGSKNLEIKVGNRSMINVSLTTTASTLNDVVVVGYGTQKKTSLTAAISTVNTKDIAKKPVVNLTNSLVGRASGLIATQGGAEPGYDGSNLLIRGIGSINGSSPLVIVDGVPRDFSELDPSSIASISILKDAAAVAPYGVAGANGVILITTKQGKAGAPVLSYNGYAGIQNPTRLPTFVNSYQYAVMMNDAAVNGGLSEPFTNDDLQKFKDHSDPDGHPDGQPLKDIIKPNRLLTYHNLSLSGGSENFKYFAALAYTHQKGMWDPTYLDKYNGTLNLTANATKTTLVNFSVNSWEQDLHFPGSSAATIIGQAQRQLPTTPVLYSNGFNSAFQGQSLYGEIYYSGYSFHENRAIQSQFSIDQKLPLKGLKLKGIISYDITPEFQRAYSTPIPFYTINTNTTPYTYTRGIQGNSKPSFSQNYSQNQAFTYQGILSYKASFGESDVDFTGVVESRRIKYQTFNAKRINYNLDIDELDYGGPGATDATNGGSSNGQKQLGYVYRLNYGFKGKYLLQVSGRYDGSYLFAPGHRFGFFPAFSAGWMLSEEKFLKGITWIDNLKLRASWGASGSNSIDPYQYLSPYNIQNYSAVLNGSSTQGVYEALQGNPNITWEKAKKLDIGFDASLWKGLLNLNVDYFYGKRSSMLVSNSGVLPGEYGIGTGLINAGIMSNNGVEITIESSHSFSNDLRLDVTGTFTYAQNKLLQIFENGSTYNNPNRRQTGRPYNTKFGLKALGYFHATDFNADGSLKSGIPVPSYGPVHPGDLQYADISGPNGKPDGVINSDDQTVIGRSQTPGIIYGIEPRLTYKGFDLDLLFQGSENSDIALNSFIVWPYNFLGSASELSFSEYWKPDRTNTLYPRITSAPTSNNTQSSSWWIRNDAYLRLKSVELGYTFATSMLRNKIKSLRIYAAGQNIFTWTPGMREYIDPENSGSDQNYYQQQVLSIGVNAQF